MDRKPRPPRHRRTPAPLQKALYPGSQDGLHGPLPPPRPPLPPEVRGGDLRGERERDSHSLSAPADSCAGIPHEQFATFHSSPEAVADHLIEFLTFRGAWTMVQRYGVDAVNQAIAEMGGPGSLRNPAGFLRWLVEQQEVTRRDR